MPQALYTYGWYFFIYAFLGWCTEVVFQAARLGKFINRGFLNGPVCPIYGFGLCTVVMLLWPYRDNLLLLYLGSVLVTSLMELITGFLMEKLFHHRWWDYSAMPGNIGGYVCPLFSLVWGLACLLIVEVIHPLIASFVTRVPHRLGVMLLAFFLCSLLADLDITVACVLKFNKKLKRLDEVSKKMRVFSDRFGENLADSAIAFKDKAMALRETVKSADAAPNYVERRLLRAFPHLRSERYPEVLEAMRRHQQELRDKVAQKFPAKTNQK